MAGQVKLPGVGPVSTRALMIGGVSAAAVMAIVWYRRKTAAAAAASTAPASASTDTTGTYDPNAVGYDPNAAGGTGGYFVPDSSTQGPMTTNAQWTQAAMTALANVADPTALAAALGAYLTGAAVTQDQTTLIDEAIAAEGYPPVAGPNGYPPAIHTQASTGQSQGGGITGGGGTATKLSPPAARVDSVTRTSAHLSWAPVTGATGYRLYDSSGGASNGEGARDGTAGTGLTINNLAPHTRYGFRMRSLNNDPSAISDPSGIIWVQTAA